MNLKYYEVFTRVYERMNMSVVADEMFMSQPAVSRIIREVGREGFILGADCTLPGEIGYERIRTAAEAARRVKQ